MLENAVGDTLLMQGCVRIVTSKLRQVQLHMSADLTVAIPLFIVPSRSLHGETCLRLGWQGDQPRGFENLGPSAPLRLRVQLRHCQMVHWSLGAVATWSMYFSRSKHCPVQVASTTFEHQRIALAGSRLVRLLGVRS